MELGGKHVMVVGLGVTGAAAARFLASRGAILSMTDRRTDLDRSKLPTGAMHLGAEDPAWLSGVDLVVTSPGVPRDSILIRAAIENGIPVIGEIELACRFITAPLVAVTGTNGKSTVVVLLGEIMKAAGMRTFVGGNLGTPLVDAINGEYDVAVVEVSSFQLESIEKFRAKVGVHLNLSDDHFDRYRNLEDYGRAKARLFENQDASDFAILNRDDPNVWKLAANMRARVISFGIERGDDTASLWHEGNAIAFDLGTRRGKISLEGFRLSGRHNIANAMAASAAALALNVDPKKIELALASFRGLPHRIEIVAEKRGVTYMIILIAGGLDKGGDYRPLRRPLTEKVKLAIFNGAARTKMRDALDGATTIDLVATLHEAVEQAARAARAGDTVLLSPACSSFDQFKDYAERGNVYKELVRAL